jgi:hypothetical protein
LCNIAFLGRCDGVVTVVGLDGQHLQFNVSPLRGDKLRLAIEAPARALGVYFEPVLVARLLHDVAPSLVATRRVNHAAGHVLAT